MKNLVKWQIFSFVSRGLAQIAGLVQSFAIIRILSVEQWGIVQVIASIGGALGIYQHLGLAGALTQSVASSTDKKEITKVFFSASIIRYVVTIPLSVGLFFMSEFISTSYKMPEIAFPLKLYAIALLFQGVQSLLNALISGTQRFKTLFSYQVGISIASVFVYVPLVYFFGINGYYYAFLIFTVLGTLALTILSLSYFKGYLHLPKREDIVDAFKRLFLLSLSIYIVKILTVNWEKLGGNLLGLLGKPEIVAIFAFALLYAKKILTISDAVTDVSLPVFSEKFSSDFSEFKKLFRENFNKLYTFILFVGMSSVVWAYEIIRILVGSDKYDASLNIVLLAVFAMMFYSLGDIMKSSVAVPARLNKEMIISHTFMLIPTVILYLVSKNYLPFEQSMILAMFLGAGINLLFLISLSERKLKLDFFNHQHLILFIQAFATAYALKDLTFTVKIPAYIILSGLFVWSVIACGFYSLAELFSLKNKIFKKLNIIQK